MEAGPHFTFRPSCTLTSPTSHEPLRTHLPRRPLPRPYPFSFSLSLSLSLSLVVVQLLRVPPLAAGVCAGAWAHELPALNWEALQQGFRDLGAADRAAVRAAEVCLCVLQVRGHWPSHRAPPAHEPAAPLLGPPAGLPPGRPAPFRPCWARPRAPP